MRNTDKFYYVEVALPKGNPAIENMVAESERTTVPLRVLIKKACIDQYSDVEDEPRSVRPVRKSRKIEAKQNDQVSSEAKATADAFLDEGW